MSDMTVANTILAQLGGNKFRAMTGARNFAGSDNSLTFRFPNRKGPNSCRVTLNSMDLYDVEFMRIRRSKGVPGVKTTAKRNGLYADQLQSVFTEETGLYTHL